MRTTLDLDERLLIAAKKRAASGKTSLTRVIEDALRLYLVPRRDVQPYTLELLVKKGRRPPSVDVADRDALYDALDERP